MRILSTLTQVFQMTDDVWARHANPWSVWTRFLCLPLLALAIWARVWIGVYAWVPILLLLFWIWLNPRAFPPPKTTNHWASKAVLGERIWLAHPKEELPPHHQTAIAVINTVTMAGFLLCLYGLYALEFWATLTGLLVTIIGKSWFLDRMVWLHQELRTTRKAYQSWER